MSYPVDHVQIKADPQDGRVKAVKVVMTDGTTQIIEGDGIRNFDRDILTGPRAIDIWEEAEVE